MRAAFCAVALLLASAVAYAHGPHQWVQDGGYRSVSDGSLCCGEHDCHHLDRANIRNVAGQWFFTLGGIEWAVPPGEVQWGEDGQYSACIWGGKVKCFFVPPNGV